MAKLYFRYGAVGSAKTLNLLAVAHNYRLQGKKVVLIKPQLDTRFGQQQIRSRAGLELDADLLIAADTVLDWALFEGAHCVLVDEAQFLTPPVIEQLREISWKCNIPVICYGLRTDFRSFLFPGSRRLLELADSIEEVKSTCFLCNKKAVFNLRHVDGRATFEGEIVQLGGEERYFPTCYGCYVNELEKAGYDFLAESVEENL